MSVVLREAAIEIGDGTRKPQILGGRRQRRLDLGSLLAHQFAVHEGVELGLADASRAAHLTLRRPACSASVERS